MCFIAPTPPATAAPLPTMVKCTSLWKNQLKAAQRIKQLVLMHRAQPTPTTLELFVLLLVVYDVGEQGSLAGVIRESCASGVAISQAETLGTYIQDENEGPRAA